MSSFGRKCQQAVSERVSEVLCVQLGKSCCLKMSDAMMPPTPPPPTRSAEPTARFESEQMLLAW